MIFEASAFEGKLRVMLDTGDASLLVEKKLGGDWVTTCSYKAANLKVLSEHLSDAVSYSCAVDMLTQWGIPKESPLWTLSHKGGDTHWSVRS